MRVSQKRCLYCHRWFTPYRRKRRTQKACDRVVCRKKRHADNCRTWRVDNPGQDEGRRSKIRTWARKRRYWKGYRQTHAGYRAREAARMRRVRRERKSVAKRDSLKKIAVDKLRELQRSGPKSVAKRDSLDRRMDGVLAFLVWKEIAAKRDSFPALSG